MKLTYTHVKLIINRYNVYNLCYDDYEEETLKIILYFECRDCHVYHEIQDMIINLFFMEDITDDQILICHDIANDLYALYKLDIIAKMDN